jgi:DNA polymerase-3 subunit delta
MESKKITKLLKNKGVFYEFNKTNNLDIIKDRLDGFKIDKESINILLDRVGDNTGILINEIEKLKTYKYDSKEITKEDVLTINKYEEIDFFKFIDHIINKEKNLALNEYFSLLNQKEEPIKILIVIASKIRLMYQVKVLSEKGYTVNDIANQLETKTYPVQLAGVAAKKYSKEKLLNTLINIGELDENIKTGKVVPASALELFIINL